MKNQKTKTTGHTLQLLSKEMLIAFAFLFFYMGATGEANAAMATVICKILKIVQGDLGRAVATMGILAVAFGATLGKVSWGLAVTVAIGITLIFQASWYASFFSL